MVRRFSSHIGASSGSNGSSPNLAFRTREEIHQITTRAFSAAQIAPTYENTNPAVESRGPPGARGLAALIPAAGIFVLFTLGMQPIENSLLAYLTPARWRSMSYGIKFTLTFGAGAFAVKIVGLMERSYGIDSVIYLVAGFLAMVILSICVFLLLSRGQQIRH